MSSGELEDKSQSIAAQFFGEFDIKKQNAIHIFISIARHNELNTFHIINRMLKDFPKVKIGVPKSDFKSLALTSYEYNLDSKLKINKLGIPEPLNVLVPLLCFDKKGNRVGYGKGFYDRYLVNVKPSTIKIGLSLFEPIDQIKDIDSNDVKLNYCIDPVKIHRF
jgi:5-formyltetrahydrofolate cyclo-ligase